MKRFLKYNFFAAVILGLFTTVTSVNAGNPDRQGEAGAYELLLKPWARSAGLNSMNTGMVSGAEAMSLNIAGISRIKKTEIALGYADYLRNSETSVTILGFTTKMGKEGNGALGISIMAMGFGEIENRTEAQPEGDGTTFTPAFFNLGVGYSHMFDNKISVGILFRVISESISDATAFGMGIDAGVQYVTGEQDNFKFGISLRNIGTRLNFEGEGLAVKASPNNGGSSLTYRQNTNDFELPSQLNIGLSYDIYVGNKHRLTPLANFTANSFSRDQLGAGLEYSFKKMFQLRGSYQTEVGSNDNIQFNNVYSGISAGASLGLKLSKKTESKLYIDYAYRTTDIFDGTHNLGVRVEI